MEEFSDPTKLYVIIETGDHKLALPANQVLEMVLMPKVTPVPKAPEYVRGVMNLRGRVMPVIDLRIRLGLPSCDTEARKYIDLFNLREEDHRRWLAELESSVLEKRPFQLATDPRQCAFGKWYYSFDYNTSMNRCLNLDHVLMSFEDPHNRIHAVAHRVLGLVEQGNQEEALKIINVARQTTLNKMIGLFADARRILAERRKELAVVLGLGESRVAMAVDVVDTVDHLGLNESRAGFGPAVGLGDDLITGVGHREGSKDIILMLNTQEFHEMAHSLENRSA